MGRSTQILAIQSAQNRDATGLLPNRHLVELVGLILKSCSYKLVNFEANKS
jgi:hypothetical protein